jgi:hypothetical protein
VIVGAVVSYMKKKSLRNLYQLVFNCMKKGRQKTVLKIVASYVKKPQMIGNAMQSLVENFESNRGKKFLNP